MPSIRDEITRTVLRFAGRRSLSSSEASPSNTVLRTGRTVSGYRILKRLGAGGMGQVYLALDTSLGRQVALKFIPPELASDTAMLHRLEQEARATSALNHPNIVTIYAIGESDGERFIASEFIEGVTLSTAMGRGFIDSPQKALDVIFQVASALAAAHAAGVIHRDVKPSNIMIRPDEYVKVIDFGIAKLAEKSRHRGVPHMDRTLPGSVVGTVDYMSPEQARGEEVDHRTDLWSLGVILYEMLTLENPFGGATENHVIVNILDKPIPDLSTHPGIAPGIAAIVQRALTKERDLRYQSAQEMIADLQKIRQTAHTLPVPHPVATVHKIPPARRNAQLITATGAFVVICLAAVWWFWFDGREAVLGLDWFRITNPRQLTFNGRTKIATISPDGKYLAYVMGDAVGGESLFLKQIDQASEEVKVPSRKISYEGLTFTPDSQTVYAVEKDQALMGRLYAIPILGERRETPLVVDIDGPPTFSPTGKEFAFVRWSHPKDAKSQSLLEVAEADGSGRHAILTLESLVLFRRPAWSPDGKLVANVIYDYTGNTKPDNTKHSDMMLNLVDLNGRQTRKPLNGWTTAQQLCWTSQSRSVILSGTAGSEGSSQSQLREISIKTGEIRELTHDLSGYRSASLTRDSKELVAVKTETKSSLWISQPNNFARGASVPAEAAKRPILSWIDENGVLLNSQSTQSGGFPNFLRLELTNQKRTILTNEAYVEEDAAVIPGTKSIVFTSNRTKQFHIWKYDADSNVYTQLTFGAGYDRAPVVSADGKWIAYINFLADIPHLRRVNTEGGVNSQIGSFRAQEPQISPNGQWIAAQIQRAETADWNIALMKADGTGEPRLVPKAQLPFRWAPDGQSLSSVITTDRGVSNVWTVPLDGSTPRKITDFDDDVIQALAWSPNGDRLGCIRSVQGSDVFMFKRQAN